MADIRYGRGKFNPPQEYVDYINMIADSPVYSGLPAIRENDGKINWQCSSGKTTSFYKYFEGRFKWWVNKADELGIPGTGNSNDRLTIVARIIHPTKKKVCLVCGKEHYVGYMYMNANFAKSWNTLTGKHIFKKAMPIYEAVPLLIQEIGFDASRKEVLASFPEKFSDIEIFDAGNYEEFFSKSQHIRSTKLSPGYMGDCPHRLDGLHDYCTFCRKRNDPGRSDENMRTYNHDRRAFMWWAEGDWKLADTLYNSATVGVCVNCGRKTKKISPDHVGPLACGFQQNAFFEPLCGKCNSAKNRRFTFDNVISLIDYEKKNGVSAASWQVRSLWDITKEKMQDDNTVKILSNYMRAMQDYYLRTLNHIALHKHYEFLSTYLHPEYANYAISFSGLNTSTLTFEQVERTYRPTNGTRSLAARSIRIAYEELGEYCAKPSSKRKSIILKTIDKFVKEDTKKIDELFSDNKLTSFDETLSYILHSDKSLDEKDSAIQIVIERPNFANRYERYDLLKQKYEQLVNMRGTELAYLCIAEIK